MSSVKRIVCGLVAFMLLAASTIMMPFKAYAYVEDGWKLNLDGVNVEVKDVWRQVRNAALVHLVTQKLYNCLASLSDMQKAKNVEAGNLWGTEALNITIDGNTIGQTDVNVGPYLSSMIDGEADGVVACNDGSNNNENIFVKFVYMYKNYTRKNKTFTGDSLDNARMSEDDLKEIACGQRNGNMLFDCSNSIGEDHPIIQGIIGVTNPSLIGITNLTLVKWYLGASYESRVAYIKTLYKEIQERSENPFILDWGTDFDLYNRVDGYYLYSLDYQHQCGGFGTRGGFGPDGRTTGDVPVVGNDGEVDWYVLRNESAAAASFVKKEDDTSTRTCGDLANKMKEYIKLYITDVNEKIYNECSREIGHATLIDIPNQIDETYQEPRSAEVQAEIDALLAEYQRIRDTGEFVSHMEGEQEVMIQKQTTGIIDEYIWQCRTTAPYITVTEEEEPDFENGIADAFHSDAEDLDKACRDAIEHLEWVICPLIVWIARSADGLTQSIEGIFEEDVF